MRRSQAANIYNLLSFFNYLQVVESIPAIKAKYHLTLFTKYSILSRLYSNFVIETAVTPSVTSINREGMHLSLLPLLS
jgi:hypothetical protein